jgi:hypothetical protein
MTKVILETSGGNRVGTAMIPPFKTRPHVLLWGIRSFGFHAETEEGEVWREVFGYYVPAVTTYVASSNKD